MTTLLLYLTHTTLRNHDKEMYHHYDGISNSPNLLSCALQAIIYGPILTFYGIVYCHAMMHIRIHSKYDIIYNTNRYKADYANGLHCH